MKFNKNEFGWKEKVSVNTNELVTKKYVDDNTQLCWLEDYEATGDRLQYADVNVSSLTSRVFYAFNFKKHPGVKTVRLLKSYDDGTIKSIIDLGSTLEYMYLMKISSSIMRFYLKYATGIVSECVCTFGNTSDECTFKRTPMVLYAKNTYEYTPTTDYNPATKKYVDDKFIAFDLMETVGTIPQSELQKCNNGTSRYVSSIDFDTLFSEPNNYMYYATYKDDTLIPIEYQSNFNRMVTNELDSADGEGVLIGFDYGTHMMYPFNGGMASIKAYTFTNDLIIKRVPILNVNEVATKKYVDDAIENIETSSGSNINDTTASATTTYSSNKIENIKENLSSQIKDIANVGKPTDEQVANVINAAIANGDIVAGGISTTAQTLLISILRNAVFTSNQSTNIDALNTALASSSSGGGTETTQYTITNSLSNSTSSNATVLVDANSSYTAIIRENDGYTLDTITVTMGGTDITSSVVSGNTITISAVTGNVVITVTTTAISSGGGSAGMVTDGLENYFDFRTATYNNEGAGGSTIISATQGNGSLYTWAKNMVTEQGDYGMAVGRSLFYNANSVGTTSTPSGTSFTWIFKCYITRLGSPLFHNGYGVVSNTAKMSYGPKYKTASGTSKVAIVGLGGRLSSGYDTVTLIVDGNICKLYFGTKLMQTNDGSTIDGFQGWYDVLEGVNMLGARGYFTQMAMYNKALSEVELVDMIEYLSSLEVK